MMEPDFQAWQFIGEVGLGLVGLSAIRIGLARADDGGQSRGRSKGIGQNGKNDRC